MEIIHKLKIAHINNISGIGTILAKEQTKLGNQVDVFVFNKKIHEQFGGIKINFRWPFSMISFYKNLEKYDVWHYHYPYGSLKKKLEKRNKKVKYLKHYHGDDLRGKKDEDFCLVSTPDLQKYAPSGMWVPNPINLDEIKPLRKNIPINKPLKIAHYPYYKNYSSEDNYSKFLKELENKEKCEIVEILNQTHSQAIKTISCCDVVIGKIMQDVGWFGMFEIEGMALGKPVVAYIDQYLYQKYKPPIYCTNKDTFKEDLQCLLEDENERSVLAQKGIKYVDQNHSLEKIIKTLNEVYKSMNN